MTEQFTPFDQPFSIPEERLRKILKFLKEADEGLELLYGKCANKSTYDLVRWYVRESIKELSK